MVGRRVTLQDVAERAGVHPATVSRALSDGASVQVKTATLERVRAAAEELGYRPNPLARGLKTNQTRTVGMLLPDLTNPFFPPIVRGVEDELGAADYTLILGNTDNDAVKAEAVLGAMLGRQVDGLILATAYLDQAVAGLVGEHAPAVVLVNRTGGDTSLPHVVADDAVGIQLVVDHLVGLGHTRIAHVAGPQGLSTGRARHRSLADGLQRAGLALDPGLVTVADAFSIEAGRVACAELVNRTSLVNRTGAFTAVVAGNDLIAIGCAEVLAESGLQVPADVSLVGYNDMRFVDKLRTPLTTVHVPQYAMGREAARMMLTRLRDQEAPVTSLRLVPTLVVRSSTGRPPARPAPPPGAGRP